MARRTRPYVIEIRDKRLRGGRLCISSRTTSKPEWRRREAAVRALLERGDLDVIERLRAREIHIVDVVRAVEDGDFERLRRPIHEPLTLGACVDRFLRTVEATRSAATLEQYEIVCRLLVERFGADTPIERITADQIEGWLHEPKATTGGRPWSPARQHLVVAACGRLWQYVIDRERDTAEASGLAPRITRNPWRRVEAAGKRQARVAFLRPEEWRELLRVVEGTPKAAMLALGCLAGLRRQEVIHLRTGIDVDLDARVIRVQPRDGEYAWRPKTDRSIRDVPISDELYRILSEHVRLGFAGDRYVIRLPGKDQPLSLSAQLKWTRAAFEAAGIKYGRGGDALTFHSLRHTFASWLAQADVQVQKIAMLLGDTVEMVTEVYAHLLPSDLSRAVQAIDAAVEGGSR